MENCKSKEKKRRKKVVKKRIWNERKRETVLTLTEKNLKIEECWIEEKYEDNDEEWNENLEKDENGRESRKIVEN